MSTLYLFFSVILTLSLAVLLWPVATNSAISRKSKTLFIGVTCLLFLIGAFTVYGWVGAPQIIPLMETRQQKLAELEKTILEDSKAVKSNPKNLNAWVRLGQSFMETSQWNAAANAFKQAVVLSGGNPALIMAYAKALILENGGHINDHAKKSLEMVLLQEPKNPEARYFLAVRQLEDGNTQQAMKNMRELYRSLPDDSPLKEMIDRQIGRKN